MAFAGGRGGRGELAPEQASLERILQARSVQGGTVFTRDGRIIHTTMVESQTARNVEWLSTLVQMSEHAVRDIDPTNELYVLRIRSKRPSQEVMVTQEGEHLIAVVQDPTQYSQAGMSSASTVLHHGGGAKEGAQGRAEA